MMRVQNIVSLTNYDSLFNQKSKDRRHAVESVGAVTFDECILCVLSTKNWPELKPSMIYANRKSSI